MSGPRAGWAHNCATQTLDPDPNMTTGTNPEPEHRTVREAVRRHAGVAALRKLRHLVDAERDREEADRRFVKRFAAAFLVVALAAAVAWMMFRGVL